MGWSIGWDEKWKRDIGYGVPAYCDHPGCNEQIDRGLSYLCGGYVDDDNRGCGLFFCSKHLRMTLAKHMPSQLCERCYPRIRNPFSPKPDHPDWIKWKLTDPSWKQWRDENPNEVEKLKKAA